MLSNSFKWKHYEGEIILLNVRWYLKYPLSYRNLKEMMIERGIHVDHSTIRGIANISDKMGVKQTRVFFQLLEFLSNYI